MSKQKGRAGIAAVAIVALLVACGTFFYAATHTSAPAAPAPGAISGPDISSPYLSINGVIHWYTRVTMRQASSTLCSIPTPAATSTLTKLTAHIANGNAYSNVFLFGYAANAFATTTSIGTTVTIAGTYGDIVASTTLATQATGDGIVYPGNFINFKVSTSSASATYLPVGDCQADFVQL